MKDEAKDWLPLGSVVLLKGGNHPIMIYGRLQKQVEENNRLWDYTACLYPEGNIDPKHNYMFNSDQIEKILFLGYQSPDEERVKAQLHAFVNEQESEHDRKKDG